VNISRWPKADLQWYLGVRCRKCRMPILFARDRSEGDGDVAPPPAGKLVLTCPLDTCKHQADYTATALSRFQKQQANANPNETERENESTKSRKHKRRA
jgi:hypothetical protein